MLDCNDNKSMDRKLLYSHLPQQRNDRKVYSEETRCKIIFKIMKTINASWLTLKRFGIFGLVIIDDEEGEAAEADEATERTGKIRTILNINR